jgi:hypothetical protein
MLMTLVLGDWPFRPPGLQSAEEQQRRQAGDQMFDRMSADQFTGQVNVGIEPLKQFRGRVNADDSPEESCAIETGPAHMGEGRRLLALR